MSRDLSDWSSFSCYNEKKLTSFDSKVSLSTPFPSQHRTLIFLFNYELQCILYIQKKTSQWMIIYCEGALRTRRYRLLRGFLLAHVRFSGFSANQSPNKRTFNVTLFNIIKIHELLINKISSVASLTIVMADHPFD